MSIEPGRYRHFKGGEYEVLGVARDSESEAEHVVYRSPAGDLWVRPAAMWSEHVDRGDHHGPRFSRIEPTPQAPAAGLVVTPLLAEDRSAWEPLWQGYLRFYETELSGDMTAETFRRLVDDDEPLHGALARDADGRAIGLVHWLTHPATWSTRDYCYLEDLFVDATSRGTGAGTALIAHVHDWAGRNGAAKVYWLTAETNATARRLYDAVATRSGFVHYQQAL